MTFGFTTEQKLLRETVRKLMDTHANRDYMRAKDQAKAFPYELYDKWVEAGLLEKQVSRLVIGYLTSPLAPHKKKET